MKKEMFIALLCSILLSQIGFCADFKDAECFDYYEYPTGVVFKHLATEKISYNAGEDVNVVYSILARMKAPIVEGAVRAQVFFNDPVEGEQMIDEFYMLEGINLMEGDVLDDRYAWRLPENSPAGEYIVKTYFVVAKQFNLAGISLSPYGPPGAPAELARFNVTNDGETSRIYFGKGDTYVNGKAFDFTAPPEIRMNGSLTIVTRIYNTGPKKDVELELAAYAWDDLKDEPLEDGIIKKTVSLPVNGNREITYSLDGLDPETYELKFTARCGNEKSILKLRIPVFGPKGRFIYLGLDEFPLSEDGTYNLFFCHSISTDYSSRFNGTIEVSLVDEAGKTLLEETTDTIEFTSTPPQSKILGFTPGKDLTKAVLKAVLRDLDGSVHDIVSVTYDYSKFEGLEAGLDVSLETYAEGERIKYTIVYDDANDRPVEGELMTYITDSQGRIVAVRKNIKVNGEYEGDFPPLPRGEYTLTVRELSSDLKAETNFDITQGAATTIKGTTTTMDTPPTTTPEAVETGGTGYLPLIILIVFMSIIIAAFLLGRKRK